MSFESFDPLSHKKVADTEVASLGLKREIKEILGSYVGWYDPLCELIQNSLDSVDARKKAGDNFQAKLRIIIDLKNQTITVSDNGVGLTNQQFNQFLVPFFSFKSGKTRGHKGVGATYLAYGFNFIQVCNKGIDFGATGKMVGARNWLYDENPSGNPRMEPDESGPIDQAFNGFDRGVSITIKTDSTTHPRDLSWIGTSDPASWFQILEIKTGLGAIEKNNSVVVEVITVDITGKSSLYTADQGIEYLYPHKFPNVRKAERIHILAQKLDKHYQTKGHQAKLPAALVHFDCLWDHWTFEELLDIIDLDEPEVEILLKHSPEVYCGFAYSVKVFNDFNESLNLRANYKLISGGFQIASNNMPQGETYQIPLQRYIGRQNQIHFVIHFQNCNADLGRKGYNKDITDFCKSITEQITIKHLNKYKPYLRPASGAPTDIARVKRVADWKEEMKKYEAENPLVLINDKFFLPTKQISITSKPTREQDVIALFNQLVAGGVIRGVRIMSTNERFTYDGLFRIVIEAPTINHIFNTQDNPLGVLEEAIQSHELPFMSHPEILEYKLSLDGLIEDISDETKNSNDIGLVVVWDTGEMYKGNYHITSLLDPDNLSLRAYHGVTHIISNLTTDQKEMDLIVLSELVDYLNDPASTLQKQRAKYESQ